MAEQSVAAFSLPAAGPRTVCKRLKTEGVPEHDIALEVWREVAPVRPRSNSNWRRGRDISGIQGLSGG
jgi:hypothetical protein